MRLNEKRFQAFIDSIPTELPGQEKWPTDTSKKYHDMRFKYLIHISVQKNSLRIKKNRKI